MANAKFKISSALKNILGRELVTDKYVAVFELVKNAADANANEVNIIFSNFEDGHYNKITITDDGDGMNSSDIVEKWLFVGYSDKRTEGHGSAHRRKQTRYYAGAKGVGRFSCDRLGSSLRLVTKKTGCAYNEVIVDWGDFEKNSLQEFSNVEVVHNNNIKANGINFRHGTHIEITSLRDMWDRDEVLTLKKHLTKLVNPFESTQSKFNIKISAKEELAADASAKNENSQVNGYVRNFVFENMKLKTIGVSVEISEDGKIIKTELKDKGKSIYSVEERNVEYGLLQNIRVSIYHLNENAKQSFYRIMGVYPVRFGSVFIYKNGFRIYPFGEPGDDSLGIDLNKQQGTRRFLGTREIIGRVEILGEQNNLNETSSRSGGIIKNPTYYSLVKFINKICLNRLQKYVVDVVKWGTIGIDGPQLEKLEVSQKIVCIIKKLVESGNIIKIKYDHDFLEVYNKTILDSSEKLPEQLEDIAIGVSSKQLSKKLKSAADSMRAMSQARREAEQRAARLESEKAAAVSALGRKEKQVLFLSQITHPNVDYIMNCCHSIITYACAADEWLQMCAKLRNKGKLDESSWREAFVGMSESNKKVIALARIITKANFNVSSEQMYGNLIQYAYQYIREFLECVLGRKMNFVYRGISQVFNTYFNPLEVGVIFENLVFNSLKAKSSNITFKFSVVDSHLNISVIDDGIGLQQDAQANPSIIFQKGYTTTKGSGLGLYFVHEYLRNMGGTVEVASSTQKGLILKISIEQK